MKARRKGGVLRIDLRANESTLMAALLVDLSAVVASEDLADPVVRRLYPDGYADDGKAAAEFRELVAGDLRSDRVERIAACQGELPIGSGRMELDPDAADRWLRVLNDLRLTLGTRLGVTEDDQLDDSSDPARIYAWLSAVQETLVQNLMS